MEKVEVGKKIAIVQLISTTISGQFND